MTKGNLTQEIDLYIKQNHRPCRPEGFNLVAGVASATLWPPGDMKRVLDLLVRKLELSFSEKLMKLINEKGRKPAEIYNKAGITKNLFSKIKTDSGYHPTKETALAFAVALHLDLDETADLLGRAGYTLSHSSESDIIVEYFIKNRMYNIDEINSQLEQRGHKTLTNWRKSRDSNE